MDALLHDLRIALRSLVRRPGFTVAVVCTLALGIGANTAIFSFVNGVLLRPLPYASPERLMTLWTMLPASGKEVASLPDFTDWRDQGRTFERMGAYANSRANIAPIDGDPERVPSALVLGELFETLGVAPALGRGFTPADAVFGAHSVVILSDALWRRRFGADRDVIGQTILLNAAPYTVIGVAPPSMRVPEGAQLWTPLARDPARGPPGRRSDFLNVIGRLAPSATPERAQAEMDGIARRLAQTYPNSNDRVGIAVIPLHEELVGPVRVALLVFAAAVGLVLLIACANVANLLLARATARRQEMAVRVALGASRARLVRQMLTESIVIAALGGALGLILALWGVQALGAIAPSDLPRLAEVRIDGAVLAFSIGISLATGLLFGLAPALRVSTLAVRGAMGDGTRGSAGGADRLRGGLVLAQVALALVLLAGSGLLVRSFERLQRVSLGFDPRGVATAQVALPVANYDDARATAFFDALRTRLAATPGVRDVGLTTDVPLGRGYNYLTVQISGRAAPAPGENMPDAVPTTADAGYFKALGIPLIAGRLFGPEDVAGSARVAVVSEEFVRRYLGGRGAIGERITFDGGDLTSWMTIVGVVGSARLEGLRVSAYPQVFGPLSQSPAHYLYVVARGTAADASPLLGAMRREVKALDAAQPVADARTMDERVSDSISQARLNSILVGSFSLIALLLASIGIYGVVSYAVAQRTREIGIRIALGATTRGVLRLIVRQGMVPALLGVGVGLAGALAVTRLLAGLLFGVSATDPFTFALVTAVLTLVALTACVVPARRAARVDPVIALRAE